MAAEETVLTWNVTNWITVLLMAAVGFAALGLSLKLLAKYKGGQSA